MLFHFPSAISNKQQISPIHFLNGQFTCRTIKIKKLLLFVAIIIGFEETIYRVRESESVMVCVNVTNPPVDVSLSVDQFFLLGSVRGGTAGRYIYNSPNC